MNHRAGLGIACALAAAALYGVIPNFARGGLENGVPPVESILFRTAVITLTCAILAVGQGHSFRLPRESAGSFLVQAFSTLLVSLGYIASVQFIPVGLAVIIFYLFPVFILLASPLAERQGPGPFRIAVALYCLLGLAIAVGPDFEKLDPRGIALATLGASGAALQAFSGRMISRHVAPAVFGFHAHMAILPVVLVVALFTGGGALQSLPGGQANAIGMSFMLGLGIVYAIAYLMHMVSLRFAPASMVAPYFNLEPVVTMVIAAVMLGERLQARQYAGGAMVLLALVAVSLHSPRKAAPA